MEKVDKKKAALALGAFFGIFHAAWALLVWFGAAQMLIDWIFSLHFIEPLYVIQSFSLGTALLLVLVTTVLGYIFGWVFAWAWNWAHK